MPISEAVLSELRDILGDRLVRQKRKMKRPQDVILEVQALQPGDLVVHADHGIGRFIEVLRPHVAHYETLFSSLDRPEGVAVLADGMSGEVQEHAYWGGMRDRIPLSQTDPMTPSGEPRVIRDGVVLADGIGLGHEKAAVPVKGSGGDVVRLGSALDLAGLEARGADVETLRGHPGVAHLGPNALDVRVPATLGAAVRVRDGVSEGRSLAADVAVGSHGYLLCSSVT